MLIVWHHLLIPEDQQLLVGIDPQVSYWPRSWTQVEVYNHAVPQDWWISFSADKYGLIWIIRRPEYSEIIYSNLY